MNDLDISIREKILRIQYTNEEKWPFKLHSLYNELSDSLSSRHIQTKMHSLYFWTQTVTHINLLDVHIHSIALHELIHI